MVKGLSKLQRALLGLAGQSRHGRITTRMIMMRIYGWIPAWTPVDDGGNSFDVHMIGRREYRSRTVSVSRSLGRLRQRGLMEQCFSTGNCLTEAGWDSVDCDNG